MSNYFIKASDNNILMLIIESFSSRRLSACVRYRYGTPDGLVVKTDDKLLSIRCCEQHFCNEDRDLHLNVCLLK